MINKNAGGTLIKSIINYYSLNFSLFIFTNAVYAQWEKVAMPGSRGGAVYSICFKDSLLFAGIKGGVYVSSDDGEHWKKVNPDLPPRENSAIVFSLALSGEKLIAAFNEPGVYISSDNGLNWGKKFSGYLYNDSKISSIEIMNNNGNIVLYAIIKGFNNDINPGLYSTIIFSDNLGTSWRKIYPDTTNSFTVIKTYSSTIFICELLQYDYPEHSYSAGSIFRSIDFGNSWLRVVDSADVSAFAFDENRIYAAGSKIDVSFIPPRNFETKLINSIIVSTDNGLSWNKVKSPLDSARVIYDEFTDTLSVISSSYAKDSHLLVGMRAYNFYESPFTTRTANGVGLYHLSQNGEEWYIADSSFIDKSVFAFESSGKNIFAATDTGVFRSTDYGSTWDGISLGMKNIYASSLFQSGNYLFANTINGIWKRPLSEITAVEDEKSSEKIPNKFKLSQNYPNPFNPVTHINYSIPYSSDVSLKVFNICWERRSQLYLRGFREQETIQ